MKEIRKKKVSFNDNIEIKFLYDDQEVIEYRKKFWEVYAIDRKRFNDRIKYSSVLIIPILEKTIMKIKPIINII